VTPRLRRLDALRNDKGPDSGPVHDQGSSSNPRTHVRRSSAQPLLPTSNPEHEALVGEAVALFSRRYGRELTKEEARQTMDRLTAFFNLLAAWESHKRSELAEENRAA
jgi:hypothetical protein